MEKPIIVQKHSMKMDMDPGTYFWCVCGKSEKQPFCDGSHKGSEFRPVKVVVDEPKRIKWCMCKHSRDGAFCDNTHRDL